MQSFMTIFINESSHRDWNSKGVLLRNSSTSKKSSSGHTIGRHRFLFQRSNFQTAGSLCLQCTRWKDPTNAKDSLPVKIKTM